MSHLKLLFNISVLFLSALTIFLTACENKKLDSMLNSFNDTNGYDIRKSTSIHPTAYITPMCYTKTTDDFNNTYNPCFACHTNNKIPNYVMNNASFQEAYNFPEPALKNPFINGFIDFSKRVDEINDNEITKYINKDNYFDKNHNIILVNKLKNLFKEWSGYIPDCYYNFNDKGFDIDPQNRPTGWVAFGYMPFLGTFFPTNGSTDDVLIRLDKSFMLQTKDGDFNSTIYSINLAIVESVIKCKNIAISPIDERLLNVDINKNGILDIANKIVYDWAPNNGKYMSYVGYAKKLQADKKLHLAGGLYPENTEFLHSVRYIKSDSDSQISLSHRMKELRYAKKTTWLTYANLLNKGMKDIQESVINPDRLETFRGNFQSGLGNNKGWIYQGFIEDKKGNLRPQSYEETLNCMGCHSGIGVTTDSTFSFPRKLDNSFQNGWYYPTQKDLKNIPENRYKDGRYEFSNYLKLNPYGDEFRQNTEVYDKFHLKNGDLNQTMLTKLHNDVTLLLYPTHKRAIELNKAYKALVELQQFYNGRAGHKKPMSNVYKEVKDGQSTHNKRVNI